MTNTADFFGNLGVFGSIVFGLCLFLLVALIIREIVCWYWKINERRNILEEIQTNTLKTNNLLKMLVEQAGKSIDGTIGARESDDDSIKS